MSSLFLVGLVASTVIDLAVFALALLLVSGIRDDTPRRLTLPRILGAVACTGVVSVAKLPIMMIGGLGLFGVVHLAFLDLFVVLPLVLLAVLLLRQSGRLVMARGLTLLTVFAGVSIVAVGLYATRIEPFRLQLETATLVLPAGRVGTTPLRIGVFSDLQTSRITDYERRALSLLMEQEPDLILIAGDVFQGTLRQFERELEPLRELLGTLRAPAGVYFVLGNCEWRPWVERIFEGLDIRVLVDERTSFDYAGHRITLAGTTLDHNSPLARRTVQALERQPGEGDLRILLSHVPDAVWNLSPDSRVDLVVAGHTHGGQVQLPFIGPPITLSSVPRRVAAGGLHELDGRRIYVSRGIGMERGQAPRLRFLCPPDVSVIELVPSQPSHAE